MKKKSFLAVLSVLALSIGLGSCGKTSSVASSSEAPSSETPSSEAPSSVQTVPTTIAIANKSDLQAEWHAEAANRQVKLSGDIEFNTTQLINEGKLTIASSDETVVSVNGTYLTAVKAGEATITVTCGTATDTVVLTILASLKEPDYVTDKTITEVWGQSDDVAGKYAYVMTSTVKSFKSGSESYGDVYLKTDTETDDAFFYGLTATASALTFDKTGPKYAFKNPADFLTNAATKDVKVGDSLTVLAIRADYKTTKEFVGIVLAVNGVAVNNGALTTDAVQTADAHTQFSYTVTGKITAWASGKTDGTAYGNFYLKTDDATSEPVFVYGASASASSFVWDATKLSKTFTNPKDFLTDEYTKTLTIGSDVTIEVVRCDYQGVIEIKGHIVNPNSATPINEANTTVSDLLKLTEASTADLYTVSGYVGDLQGTKYGGFNLYDAAGNNILVYGASATETCLSYTTVGTVNTEVKFTNPNDFLTNETTKAIKEGDYVTMKAIFKVYGTTKEIVGQITKVEAGKAATDFTALTAAVEVNDSTMGTAVLSKTEAITFGEAMTVTVTPATGYQVASVKLNGTALTADATDATKYAFTATYTNKVVVTFEAIVTANYTAVSTYTLPASATTDSSTSLDAAGVMSSIALATNTVDGTSVITSCTSASNVYIGKKGLFKMGTGSKAGELVLGLTSTDEIKKVTVSYAMYSTGKEGNISINGGTEGSFTDSVGTASYTSADAITSVDLLTVKNTDPRVYLTGITFYKIAA